MRQNTSADLSRFILVGAVGVAAGLFPFAVRFGIVPDWRVCLVVAWLAGLAAVLVRPGWAGFLTLASAIVVTAVIADMSSGVSGLLALGVVILLVPAAHGALVGFVARRVVTLGPAKSIRDQRVIGAALVAVLVVVFVAVIADEFARNPP